MLINIHRTRHFCDRIRFIIYLARSLSSHRFHFFLFSHHTHKLRLIIFYRLLSREFNSLFSSDNNHWKVQSLFSFSIHRSNRASFMKQLIAKQHVEICFQLKDFLRTNHKFFDLVAIDIKFFVTNVTNRYFFSITSKFIRTREKFIERNKWSEFWAINRFEFRKVVISLEKIFNLSFNFSRHSRKTFKNSSAFFDFASSRLYFSKKFSSLLQSFDLVERILNANSQSSSSLITASSTSLSSNIFIENSVQSTTFDESFTMSDFTEQSELSN